MSRNEWDEWLERGEQKRREMEQAKREDYDQYESELAADAAAEIHADLVRDQMPDPFD